MSGWIPMAQQRPEAGSLIVKRWRHNGAVWAGVYSGAEKDSSFDEWCRLPAPPAAGVPSDASAWWALVMGAAASIEDVANCLRDPDAKKQADGAAKHYREAAQKLFATPGAPAEGQEGAKGRAMAEPTLPPLPPPKVRRHLIECAIFDPTPGSCDCGSPPKVYDRLEMESYAARAVDADRAATGVMASNGEGATGRTKGDA